jgi:prevent-host-death family protein
VYTRNVNRIGIRELRQDLSSQVKRAAAGETIIVTVDGEAKARLSPLEPASGARTMEGLIASGRVIPAKRRGQKPPDAPPRVKGGRPSQEILGEIRADRF